MLIPTTFEVTMRLFTTAFSVLALAAAALAAPLAERSVTALSSSQLSAFAPFTQFARAAYCPSDKVKNWSCGQACNALPGFQPTLIGGDGNAVQLCELLAVVKSVSRDLPVFSMSVFVGYWPQQNSVVVAHQGTDPTAL